jgi:hypothetical protein
LWARVNRILIEHAALAEACLEMGLTVDLARPGQRNRRVGEDRDLCGACS